MKSRSDLPVVVLAGRKNVGKSSIFNRLVGYRRSLVANYEGLTRDPVIFDTELEGKPVRLVDLPGYFINPENDIESKMNYSFKEWLKKADLIIFVGDGRTSITKEDIEIADMIRKSGNKYIFVINKAEYHPVYVDHMSEFYSLSMGDPLPIAAEHAIGFDTLIENILQNLPETLSEIEKPSIRVAIVGKPNVGKSSLINSILGEELSIVTEIPGTTRDTLDASVKHNDAEIVFMDTAGLRRRSKVKKGSVESFSGARTIRAIIHSDVCILVVDSSDGISTQDKKIASMILENTKASVIAMNKWDIRISNVEEEVQKELLFIDYSPKVAVSAKNNWNIKSLMDEVVNSYSSYTAKIQTSKIAKAATEFAYTRSMPAKRGNSKLKIYYATQISTAPPTFAVFVNFPELFTDSLKRSLVNFIRKRIPELSSSPIRIVEKARR